MTRAELETYLRASAASALVTMALTDPGPPPVPPDDAAISAWLDFPIGDALRMVGYPAALFSGVTDADLALVPAATSEKFLIVAMWKFKVQLRGNLPLYDLQQGTDSQKLSQLTAALDADIKRLEAQIAKQYPGLFGANLTAGRIRLGGRSRRSTEFDTFRGCE